MDAVPGWDGLEFMLKARRRSAVLARHARTGGDSRRPAGNWGVPRWSRGTARVGILVDTTSPALLLATHLAGVKREVFCEQKISDERGKDGKLTIRGTRTGLFLFDREVSRPHPERDS